MLMVMFTTKVVLKEWHPRVSYRAVPSPFWANVSSCGRNSKRVGGRDSIRMSVLISGSRRRSRQ